MWVCAHANMCIWQGIVWNFYIYNFYLDLNFWNKELLSFTYSVTNVLIAVIITTLCFLVFFGHLLFPWVTFRKFWTLYSICKDRLLLYCVCLKISHIVLFINTQLLIVLFPLSLYSLRLNKNRMINDWAFVKWNKMRYL